MQEWTSKAIEPSGEYVEGSKASQEAGVQWANVGYLYKGHSGVGDDYEIAGKNMELCTRLDHANIWLCEGTYQSPFGYCDGQLTYAGPYSDEIGEGKYTITGGTGVFDGATGYILDKFSYETEYSSLTAYIKWEDVRQHAGSCSRMFSPSYCHIINYSCMVHRLVLYKVGETNRSDQSAFRANCFWFPNVLQYKHSNLLEEDRSWGQRSMTCVI